MSTPRGAALRRRARARTLSFARGHAYRSRVRARRVRCARRVRGGRGLRDGGPTVVARHPRGFAHARGERDFDRDRVRGVLRRRRLRRRVSRHARNVLRGSRRATVLLPHRREYLRRGDVLPSGRRLPLSTRERASAGGEVRRVSPWYALFSLLIPFACLAMCCYACFRRPSQPPPPAPYYAAATQQGPYHTQTGGYPVPQRQQGYGASNLAGAGASAYSAPPPPLNPPPIPSAPTYPPDVPFGHSQPVRDTASASAVHDMKVVTEAPPRPRRRRRRFTRRFNARVHARRRRRRRWGRRWVFRR